MYGDIMKIYWPNEVIKRNNILIRRLQEIEDPLSDKNLLNQFMIVNKALYRSTYEFLFNSFDSFEEERSFRTLILIDTFFLTNTSKKIQIWDYEFFEFIVSKLLINNKYRNYGFITLHLFIQRFSEYEVYLLMNKIKREHQEKVIKIILEGIIKDLKIEKNPNNFFKILHETSFGPAPYFFIENLSYINFFNKILGYYFNKTNPDLLIPHKSEIIEIIKENFDQIFVKNNIFTLFKTVYLFFYEKNNIFFEELDKILKSKMEKATSIKKILELTIFLKNTQEHPFFLKFYKDYFKMIIDLGENPKNVHVIGELLKSFNLYSLKDKRNGKLVDIEFFKILLEKLEFFYRTGVSLSLNVTYQIIQSLTHDNLVLKEEKVTKIKPLKIDKESFNERITRITKKIPVLNKDRLNKWLNNFLESEQEFALRLMENFRFIDTDELKSICIDLYIKLIEAISYLDAQIRVPEDLVFINFGEEAKSKNMISYYFRLATNLPEKNFMNLFDPSIDTIPENKAIIIIDDILGSGKQFLEYWKSFNENIKILWEEGSNDFFNSNKFIYLPLFITEQGKDNIKDIPNFAIINLPHNLLINKNMPLSNECDIFDIDEIELVRKIFLKYGKKLYSKAPLGYGNMGLLIAFFYNTPNNTLPIIWQKSPSEFCDSMINWEPLFPRYESRQ